MLQWMRGLKNLENPTTGGLVSEAMKLIQILLVLTVLNTINGCGYRFGYASRSLPGGYDQLAIPVFKNNTQIVGIEPYFTNAIREEFDRSKIAKVVTKGVAPVVLNGAIIGIQLARGVPTRGNYDPDAGTDTSGIARLPKNTALSTELRVIVSADLELVRSSDKKVLWRGSFQNEVLYSTARIGTGVVNAANANYNDSIFHQKVSELSLVMMEEAHDRVTENF